MGALDSVGRVSLRGVYVYKDGTYDVLLEIWVDEAARCGLYITHWSDCYSSAHRKHCVDANLTCRCLLHATQRVFVRALHLPNVRSGVLSCASSPMILHPAHYQTLAACLSRWRRWTHQLSLSITLVVGKRPFPDVRQRRSTVLQA